MQVPPTTYGNTTIHVAGYYTATEETTVYLSINHNAGSARNIAGGVNNTYIRALRIK